MFKPQLVHQARSPPPPAVPTWFGARELYQFVGDQPGELKFKEESKDGRLCAYAERAHEGHRFFYCLEPAVGEPGRPCCCVKLKDNALNKEGFSSKQAYGSHLQMHGEKKKKKKRSSHAVVTDGARPASAGVVANSDNTQPTVRFSRP